MLWWNKKIFQKKKQSSLEKLNKIELWIDKKWEKFSTNIQIFEKWFQWQKERENKV